MQSNSRVSPPARGTRRLFSCIENNAPFPVDPFFARRILLFYTQIPYFLGKACLYRPQRPQKCLIACDLAVCSALAPAPAARPLGDFNSMPGIQIRSGARPVKNPFDDEESGPTLPPPLPPSFTLRTPSAAPSTSVSSSALAFHSMPGLPHNSRAVAATPGPAITNFDPFAAPAPSTGECPCARCGYLLMMCVCLVPLQRLWPLLPLLLPSPTLISSPPLLLPPVTLLREYHVKSSSVLVWLLCSACVRSSRPCLRFLRPLRHSPRSTRPYTHCPRAIHSHTRCPSPSC